MRRNRLSTELMQQLQILKYYLECARVKTTHPVRITSASEPKVANQVTDRQVEPGQSEEVLTGAPEAAEPLDTEQTSSSLQEHELSSIMCCRLM